MVCDTHISFPSVAYLYVVYTRIDRLVETSNITYRNTETHPTHILRFSLCSSSVIYLCACVRVSHRHVASEYRTQKHRNTHTCVVTSTTERRKHGYLSGGGLYACCRCKLAPWYRLRNRTRSHCMNIICIQVGYMAGAGISWLASINDYMEPTDVGGPATPRLALYLLRPPIPPRRLRYH